MHLSNEERELLIDARKNFRKEMPLSLNIERYQRNKMLSGLDPSGLKQ